MDNDYNKGKSIYNFKTRPQRSYLSNYEFTELTKEIINKANKGDKYEFNFKNNKNVINEIDKILNELNNILEL